GSPPLPYTTLFRSPAARLEALAGDAHRPVGVGLLAAGHLAQAAAVDGAQAVEGGTAGRRAILAIDEGPRLDAQLAGAAFPILAGQAHGESSSCALQGSNPTQRAGPFQYFCRSGPRVRFIKQVSLVAGFVRNAPADRRQASGNLSPICRTRIPTMRRYRSDTRFDQAQSIAELEHMARCRLPHFAWEYLAGGAEEEITLRRNRQAFAEIGLLPSTLVSRAELDTSRELFGQTRPLPLAIGPTGFNGMLHRDADIALARAARDKGIPFSLSTVSSNSLEEVAAAVPDGELWFQLYWLNDADVQEDLLRRAEAAGVRTLLLTSDAVLIGNREWDRRNFARPLQLTWRNKLDVIRHPGWIRQALW